MAHLCWPVLHECLIALLPGIIILDKLTGLPIDPPNHCCYIHGFDRFPIFYEQWWCHKFRIEKAIVIIHLDTKWRLMIASRHGASQSVLNSTSNESGWVEIASNSCLFIHKTVHWKNTQAWLLTLCIFAHWQLGKFLCAISLTFCNIFQLQSLHQRM